MTQNMNGAAKGEAGFTLRVATELASFTDDEWSRLRGTSRDDPEGGYNPFISLAFLKTLEETGCATRRTGWMAQHLRLESPDGRLIGAVPCYLKSHSQGEYVFDYGWADAFERAGGTYYPKLQISVPFTPVTGPRLLVDRAVDPASGRAALVAGIKTLTERLGVSSAHVTFGEKEDVSALEDAGFLLRTDPGAQAQHSQGGEYHVGTHHRDLFGQERENVGSKRV